MGSFNATCILSGLPIEAGDKVRFLALARSAFHGDGNDHVCYVGGRWQVHGVPVKAEYNDYGSIEKIEESLTTRIFFEALKRGAVEKGVGDNQCHDVAVHPDMSQEAWLRALWEGRVFVQDYKPVKDWDPSKSTYEPPPGVPSLRRIEGVVTGAGFQVTADYGAAAYVLDEVSQGFIRIRYSAHPKDSTELEQLLPFVHAAGFAAMITAGTGTYSNYSEILVAPLPPTDRNIFIRTPGLAPDHQMETREPRPVSQAMVREDVWQILLATPIKGDDKTYKVEDLRASAIEAVEEELAFRARRDASTPEELLARALRRDLEMDSGKSNRFLYYLGGHEGLSGYTLKSAFRLGTDLSDNPEDLKTYVLDLADTVYAQWVYSSLHGQWHPTTNSGQEGKWDEHRAFLLKLAEIKGRYEDEDEENDEPDTEEPQTDNDADDDDEP
jgi:hypothetical protein